MIGPNNGAVINILSYIPVQYWDGIRDGTNTTNLTTYIQNALNDGYKHLYFPKGQYRIVDSGILAITSWNYALTYTGTGIIIEGDGSDTDIHLDTHESQTILMFFGSATGTIHLKNIKLSCPATVTAATQGPWGVSIGEMGLAGTNGTLDEIKLENIHFENLSTFAHGTGAKKITIINPIGTQDAGGTFSSNELINFGSIAGTYKCEQFRLEGFDFTADNVSQSDHCVYLLGEFGHVYVGKGKITKTQTATFKFLGELPADASWPSNGWDSLTVEDIVTDGIDSAASAGYTIMLSGANECGKVSIQKIDNTAAANQFIYSEWKNQVITIENNNAQDCKDVAVQLDVGATLSPRLGGIARITGNNFDGFDTGLSASDGIICNYYDLFTLIKNKIEPTATSTARSVNHNHCTISVMRLNQSSAQPLYATSPTSYNSGVVAGGNTWAEYFSLTLSASWVAYTTGGSWGGIRVYKEGKTVHLSGRISSGTTTNGTTIATLPIGCRPTASISRSVIVNNAGTFSRGRIEIDNTGVITIQQIAGNTYMDLNGASFMAELV